VPIEPVDPRMMRLLLFNYFLQSGRDFNYSSLQLLCVNGRVVCLSI
jgi:hypothetical protein